MIELKTYDPIMDNSYHVSNMIMDGQKEDITRIDTKWIVTEKLHGAQVVLVANKEGEFTMNSRIRELGPSKLGDTSSLKTFFRSDILYERIKDKIPHIHGVVAEYGLENIHIFGEWFGEWEDEEGKMCAIQTGIEYGGLFYRVFDMAYKRDGEWEYFEYYEMMEIAEKLGFETPPFIAEYDCLYEAKEDINMDDMLTQINPVEGNYIEGVVIRPVDSIYVLHRYRVMLKIKHPTYAERRSSQYSKRTNYRFKIAEYDETAQKMLDLYLSMMTVNRYNNMISKTGEGLIIYDYIQLFQEDVQNAFIDNLNELGDVDMQYPSNIFNLVCKMGGEQIPRFLLQNTNVRDIAGETKRQSVTIPYNKNFVSGRGDYPRGFTLKHRL